MKGYITSSSKGSQKHSDSFACIHPREVMSKCKLLAAVFGFI